MGPLEPKLGVGARDFGDGVRVSMAPALTKGLHYVSEMTADR
jgi:hypothetical protein